MEQRSLNLFSPAMPKVTVIFIQKLLLIILISDGDKVLFDACSVLNTTVWPQLNDSNKDAEILSVQLTAINSIFERFKLIPVFKSATCESLLSGCVGIIHYAHPYFAVDKIKPMNLWSKICLGNKKKESWHDIIQLVELCLCTLFSNATPERNFSHLKLVKTEIRLRLVS